MKRTICTKCGHIGLIVTPKEDGDWIGNRWAALHVITRTPAIRAWLEANYPKALQQCEEALK